MPTIDTAERQYDRDEKRHAHRLYALKRRIKHRMARASRRANRT